MIRDYGCLLQISPKLHVEVSSNCNTSKVNLDCIHMKSTGALEVDNSRSRAWKGETFAWCLCQWTCMWMHSNFRMPIYSCSHTILVHLFIAVMIPTASGVSENHTGLPNVFLVRKKHSHDNHISSNYGMEELIEFIDCLLHRDVVFVHILSIGTPIKCGSMVRFVHSKTKRLLHSHLHEVCT